MLMITPELQEIFAEGAQALEGDFRPGHAVHLAIDWQRLYCDPKIPTNTHNNIQKTQKILATLGQVNDFADDVRAVAPTWWIYHDLELDEKDHIPKNYFQGIDADETLRRIAAIRAEGNQICGRVDPEKDIVLRKPFRNAFDGTDLHERLQRREIDTLLVTGLYRHYSYNPSRGECVGQTMKAAADMGYKTFVVEDLTVDKVDHTASSQLAVAKMTRSENAYSVLSDQVRKIAAKYQP